MEIAFPGTSHVALLGLDKADDSDVWYYARHHGYTLVTKNTDMVDLCVLRGSPPLVIWLRIGNSSTDFVRDVLARNEERIRQIDTIGGRTVLSLFRFSAVE
jgi:predicted nuclease of predicted toxin-antitoxin system